jgi:hypothetical protein
MATAEQMAAYAAALREYLPAQDKPVTEIAIFKLLAPQSASTLAYFEQQIIANTRSGVGIKRQSYGFSTTDLRTFIWMIDWVKIQDHWNFWQTPEFEPVMACIEELFEVGRPLVRHYAFEPMEMLPQVLQRVVVWNDDGQSLVPGMIENQCRAVAKKDAYAVDMGETTWHCAVIGYESEANAAAEEQIEQEGVESHVVRLKFV